MTRTSSDSAAGIERSHKLHDELLSVFNAHGQQHNAHPADQLAALVALVAAVLTTYRIPPSVFLNRVIITMAPGGER